MFNMLHLSSLWSSLWRPPWRGLDWLTRLIIIALALVAVPVALAVVILRYWILPDIDQYHDRITASLAGAIGSPVSIGKIEGDWRGLQPHLSLSDVRILNVQQQPVLLLPRIDSEVSWLSLLTAELRLASLEINKPELLIRRDAQGKLFIGGVTVTHQGGDNRVADWLLRQSRMVVRDALIVWVDEQRAARPLILKQVNLRIENSLNRHRFALHALPPEDMATPLDVRGEFHGASLDDLGAWRGQIFTQLDYTDVTAWRPWLDLPDAFSRGRGALRGWLAFADGKLAGITADVAMYDVVTQFAAAQFADAGQELRVTNLRGRAAWQKMPDGYTVSTQRLTLRLQNGIEFQPTDIYFRAVNASDTQPATREIRANFLQLESLAGLAKFLPMQADLSDKLDAYAPRGQVYALNAQWRGTDEKFPAHKLPAFKLPSFKLQGQFVNLAVNQVGKLPGFSGLTIDVDGSDTSGKLRIDTHRLTVDAPGIMREPLYFADVVGQASWQRTGDVLAINVDNIAVTNDDMAGNVFGSYQTLAGTLGVLDLTGKLTRGDIRRAARYTPLVALDQVDNDWLNNALLAGHTEDFSIRIKGNLSDFPLDGTKDALLQIGGHARGAVLEFHPQWPRIENISGEFLLHGNKLVVKSSSAAMAGSLLRNVAVTIPDVQSKNLALEITGEAVAPSKAMLQFIQHSPVRGYINGFTDAMSATGNAHLDLSLRIPLPSGGETGTTVTVPEKIVAKVLAQANTQPLKVLGKVRVQDNDIDPGDGIPVLRNTSGLLTFTETGMKASDIQAEMLGGPVSIDMQSTEGGGMHATVRGRSNMEVLRKRDAHPLLNYLQGSAAWEADISVANKSAQVAISSDLQGLQSTLPQPFSKAASEKMPLRVEKRSVSKGWDVISAQLGQLLSAELTRREVRSEMVIRHGTINFGKPGSSGNPGSFGGAGKSLESNRAQRLSRGKNGVWLSGTLPVYSIQGWEGLAGVAGKSSAAFPFAGADLFIEKLTGYGQTINGVRINASKQDDGIAAQIFSGMANGEVKWQPHVAATLVSTANPGQSPKQGQAQVQSQDQAQDYDNNGKLTVNLRNFHWMKSKPPAQPGQPEQQDQTGQLVKPEPSFQPGKLPAVEVLIENLKLSGRQIGRFELVGHPDGEDWRMRRLRITNPDGALMGDGVWHGNARSQVNLMLDISDAGKILERSSYPNTVKGGSGRLTANLSWAGTPDEFNYATLNGTLKLDTGKGRFLKMDPGIGKLLSILSMQSLPKRISLDFTDVFSEGFQFDNIIGSAQVKNGVLDTQDFFIVGSAAKVNMTGSVDLNHETQNLRVKISPSLGDTVSLIGLIAIHPAVGIGTLIANEVLGKPLDKLASFEYNVTGTWTDPSVVKVQRTPAKPLENN